MSLTLSSTSGITFSDNTTQNTAISVYSTATANGSAASRTVYLTPGTWQIVLDTRAYRSDTANYNFFVTQSASITGVSGSTVSTSIWFYRAGGAGYGRAIHGSALAVATVSIAAAGNYSLVMNAVALNGADASEGSRVTLEKLS